MPQPSLLSTGAQSRSRGGRWLSLVPRRLQNTTWGPAYRGPCMLRSIPLPLPPTTAAAVTAPRSLGDGVLLSAQQSAPVTGSCEFFL